MYHSNQLKVKDMFVEPCCAEAQIPKLIRNSKGNALFQTNGDVTIEKLMQAACCMASGGFGEYWICIREVDVVLMRFLRHWMNRGWIRELRLLTATDQREMVASELGEELMKHVDYGWRDGLGLEAFCVVGERESMVVQGEMLLSARTEPVMTAYSAAVGLNERMLSSEGAVGSLVENLRAVLRLSKRKARKKKDEAKASEDAAEPKAEVEAPTEDTPTEAVETPTSEQPETAAEAPTEE